MPGGLFTPGYYQQLKGPVAVIGKDVDAQLRRTNAPVRLTLDAKAAIGDVAKRGGADQDRRPAQRGGGRCAPGLGCRAARASTTTRRVWRRCWKPPCSSVARRPSPTRCGSRSGVPAKPGWRGRRSTWRALARDGLNDVALYLNFDLLGSPNAGFFTYDGDQSGQPNPDLPASSVPAGLRGNRTHAGRLPEPRGCPARRHAAGPRERLQPVPDRGHPDRRHHHRGVAAQDRSAGPAVGRAGGRAVRPRATTRPATRSTTSTATRCRSPARRWPSRSAPTRSRPTASTASRRGVDSNPYAGAQRRRSRFHSWPAYEWLP